MSNVYAAFITSWVIDGSNQCRTFVCPVCYEVLVLVVP